jgi:hypothetical protein
LDIVFPFKVFGYGEDIVMFPLIWNGLGFNNGVEEKCEEFEESG